MPNKSYKLLVLMPVLNEVNNLDRLIDKLPLRELDAAALFIVTTDSMGRDDGSLKKIQEISSKDNRIHYINNKKRGLAIAYKQGLSYALEKFDCPYFCTLDADGSHSAKSISNFYNKVDDADIVLGSRYIRGGDVGDWNQIRLGGSVVVNKLISLFTISNIHDFTSGFRIYSRSILEKIKPQSLHSRGFVFQVEILFKAINFGAHIRELSYPFCNRKKRGFKISIS